MPNGGVVIYATGVCCKCYKCCKFYFICCKLCNVVIMSMGWGMGGDAKRGVVSCTAWNMYAA